MSQQGPVIIVSDAENAALAETIGDAKLFPLIDSNWPDATQAVARVQPAAVIAANSQFHQNLLAELARQVESLKPYAVLIVIDPASPLPPNAIPFTHIQHGDPSRLTARLNAALRVRTLHATVLRRIRESSLLQAQWPMNDPLDDANVLLIGRGASYPSLSVALGERMGVIGALSIEAAAKHLNTRDIDGIVVGEGFSARVVDAFLTVLAEDSRFRNLPVILTGDVPTRNYDLPNIERACGMPLDIAINAVPLIRKNAFEARLNRVLKSIDAGGLLDPHTGLLTQEAFKNDFTKTLDDTLERGAALSIARLALPNISDRTRFEAARILSRLMRRMDFATLRDDDSIIVAFAETEIRNARMIAQRLASILRQTVFSKRDRRLNPDVSLATLLPNDSVDSILKRLESSGKPAAH